MLTHRVGLSGTAALLAVLLTSCAPRVTQHPSAPTAQQSTTSLVYISDTSGINVRPSFTLQYTTIVQFPLFNTYAPPIAVDPSGNLWSLGLQNKFVYEYRPPNYSGLSYPVDMVPYFLAFRPRTSHLWLIGSKHGLLTLEELRTRDQLYTLPVLRAFDVRINVSSSLPSNVSVKGLTVDPQGNVWVSLEYTDQGTRTPIVEEYLARDNFQQLKSFELTPGMSIGGLSFGARGQTLYTLSNRQTCNLAWLPHAERSPSSFQVGAQLLVNTYLLCIKNFSLTFDSSGNLLTADRYIDTRSGYTGTAFDIYSQRKLEQLKELSPSYQVMPSGAYGLTGVRYLALWPLPPQLR